MSPFLTLILAWPRSGVSLPLKAVWRIDPRYGY